MDHVILMTQRDRHNAQPQFVEVESCHSIWSFDVHNHRFRRTLRGFEGMFDPPTTEWRPYYRFEEYPGSDSFVVWLNPDGTRLLRSWRHRPHCASCGDQRTTLSWSPAATNGSSD